MSTTTAKKPQAAKTTKPAPEPATATKDTKPKTPSASAPAPRPKAKASKPEPKTLVEALDTGQCVLIKVRANGTKRSLPYWPEGSDQRVLAHATATMKADARPWRPSPRRCRCPWRRHAGSSPGWRWPTDVEAGKFDKAWKPGTTEVVVHTVTAKA